MKFSYAWLQEYFEQPLPAVEELARLITMHAFEIESIEAHGTDTILDIKVLPNRSHDCLSYWGVAREIGTLLHTTPRLPALSPKTSSSISSSAHLTLSIEDTGCIRALKRYAENVSIGESPAWLKEKLSAQGQRSINNVVDVTNLVMFETGQPVHVFDFDKLAGGDTKTMSIRPATEGETLTTLDGKELVLDPSVMVISDSEKALDIAGVKGGKDSGVSETTTKLVFSVCNFDSVRIRKTAKKLSLRTDASVRFENAIAPELAEVAMARLTELLADLAGASVAEDVVEVFPRPKNPYKVGASVAEINTILGTEFSKKDIEATLAQLGFSYEIVSPREKIVALAQAYVGAPYTMGASVLADAPKTFDCSSLITYVYGHAGITIPRVSVDQYVFSTGISEAEAKPGDLVFSNSGHGDIHYETKEFMKGTKVPEGVDHVGVYLGNGMVAHASRKNKDGLEIQKISESPSFVTGASFRRILISEDERFVVTVPAPRLDIRIKEDLAEEIGRVRGFESIASRELPSFEGTVAVNKNEHYKSIVRKVLSDAGFSEIYTYAFVKKGVIEMANPIAADKKYLRETLADSLKDALKANILNKPLLGVARIQFFEIGTVFAKDMSEHQELVIVSEKKADVDEVVTSLEEVLGVSLATQTDGSLAVINLSNVIEVLPEVTAYTNLPSLPQTRFAPISAYPFVLRDIAVWITEGDAGSIPAIVRTHGGSLVARIDLFDTFTKEGRTSYAYHIVFQSNEKTLSDVEVSEIMGKIEDEIRGKGWEVR